MMIKQQAWRVRWQSPTMPAPAFWYFATKEGAEAAAKGLQSGTVVSVEHIIVDTDLFTGQDNSLSSQ